MRKTSSLIRRHLSAGAINLSIVIILIASTAGCGNGIPQNGGFEEGSGTASDPYRIANWYHLDSVRDRLDAHFILVNNLDSTSPGYEELASPTANQGKGWEPIGTGVMLYPFRFDEQYIPLDTFAGSFDGQGYEIGGLFIDRPDEDFVALFGAVDGDAVIVNVGVVNTNVTGYVCVGNLIGYNNGTVDNSHSTGCVDGEGYVGGLVGVNRADVTNSYSITTVTGNRSTGGLVGHSRSTVHNSHYDCDEGLINGDSVITVGALSNDEFDDWLANEKQLDIDQMLSQEDGYYVVNNVSDFKALLAFGQDSSLQFRLKNDLDLSGEPGLYIPYFAGEFDGNGHTISNINLDLPHVWDVGLFGYLASSGNITGLGVLNVSITGDWIVGGVVGYNYGGSLSDCYSTGSVTGQGWIVGGLVAENQGTVSDSHSSTTVTGDQVVGGLIGMNDGPVYNCYSTGSATGNWTVGGLIGETNHIVSNCYSTASATGDELVGGLVGANNVGPVSNSYATGSVTGSAFAGGWTAGGLVGVNRGAVSDCYSTGSVSGTHHIGGLVGRNSGTVSNSYSIGSVSGEAAVGGLLGYDNDGTVSNSFWDTQASGQTASAGGTGKNTTEMMNITTFDDTATHGLDDAWDITTVSPGTTNQASVWNIVDGETYPFLSWQPAS